MEVSSFLLCFLCALRGEMLALPAVGRGEMEVSSFLLCFLCALRGEMLALPAAGQK
jgi:hypothetical protein